MKSSNGYTSASQLFSPPTHEVCGMHVIRSERTCFVRWRISDDHNYVHETS